MALSKVRLGEIAYAYLKSKVRNDGIENFNATEILGRIRTALPERELKEAAVTEQEAIDFVKSLLDELFRDLMIGLGADFGHHDEGKAQA